MPSSGHNMASYTQAEAAVATYLRSVKIRPVKSSSMDWGGSSETSALP